MTQYYPSWKMSDSLSFIGKVATIKRPSGDLKNVLIKNILLDKPNNEIKEILYIEDRGAGETCLLKVGKDVLIKPSKEKPVIPPVNDNRSIEELAGDKG